MLPAGNHGQGGILRADRNLRDVQIVEAKSNSLVGEGRIVIDQVEIAATRSRSLLVKFTGPALPSSTSPVCDVTCSSNMIESAIGALTFETLQCEIAACAAGLKGSLSVFVSLTAPFAMTKCARRSARAPGNVCRRKYQHLLFIINWFTPDLTTKREYPLRCPVKFVSRQHP